MTQHLSPFFLLTAFLCSFILSGCLHRKNKLSTKVLDDFFNHKVIRTKKLPKQDIDNSLKHYISEFVKDAREQGIQIPDQTVNRLRILKYVDQLTYGGDKGVIATCNRFISTQKVMKNMNLKNQTVRWYSIEVHKKGAHNFVDGVSHRLKILLYHELFHCFLNKGHLPRGYSGLMSPILSKNNEKLMQRWPVALQEAFSPKYLDLIPNSE